MKRKLVGAMKSPRWGYFRIITGTILGGILGFYCMHRAELKYKVLSSSLIQTLSCSFSMIWVSSSFELTFVFTFEQEMWNERLRKYEEELNKRKNQEAANEFQESL